MARPLDEGSPETCGELAGSGAGRWLHRRAREANCDPCAEHARSEDNRRYRENEEHAENRRRYARARQRALNALARRHRAEFDIMLRRELRIQWESPQGAKSVYADGDSASDPDIPEEI